MKVNEKIQRPSLLLLIMEARTLLEAGSYFLTIPFLKSLSSFPKGDGHPVLVLPGFMASDLSTQILRNFLDELGYTAYPWNLGRNLAHFEELELMMNERVKWLHDHYGRKVSLIGWSLGGVYAREIAKAMPQYVRQVITLGSPFAAIDAENNAEWVYELVSGKKIRDIEPQLLERIVKSPPVPTTAIFTRGDGVVSWKSCVEPEEGPITENIEVWGSHCGLGHNPMVMLHIAERLAQSEGQWKPFRDKYGKAKAA
ncbi:MAG: alpha/beta hydrolase [Microscillaceae bacterium]|nr:alpha/beta hydrolase [Microscillaceae bacterium]